MDNVDSVRERIMKERRRQDDSLAIILSSLGSGVERRLKSNLAKVLHQEEYPKDEEGNNAETHDAVKDLYFTNRQGDLTQTFYDSWMRYVSHLMLEPVGMNGNDYLLDHRTLSELARSSVREGIIPQEHYDYLMTFREKILKIDS